MTGESGASELLAFLYTTYDALMGGGHAFEIDTYFEAAEVTARRPRGMWWQRLVRTISVNIHRRFCVLALLYARVEELTVDR